MNCFELSNTCESPEVLLAIPLVVRAVDLCSRGGDICYIGIILRDSRPLCVPFKIKSMERVKPKVTSALKLFSARKEPL